MLEITIICIVVFVASVLGTAVGFGASIIMMPFLLMLMPIHEALLLATCIAWIDGLWRVVLFHPHINWRPIIFFSIPAVIFSLLGVWLVLASAPTTLITILGVFLIAYSIFILTKHHVTIPKKDSVVSFSGALSGLADGLLGMGGPVRAIVLSSIGLKKEVYLATTGIVVLVVDLVRVGGYHLGGVRLDTLVLYSLPMLIVVSFVGAKLAEHFVERISEKTFQVIIAVVLLVLGIKMLLPF